MRLSSASSFASRPFEARTPGSSHSFVTSSTPALRFAFMSIRPIIASPSRIGKT